MDYRKLGDALLRAGAPALKDLVVGAVGGGLKGKIAGRLIDHLAEELSVRVSSPDALPDAIAEKIEKEPEVAVPVIKQVQDEFASTVDIGSGGMQAYLSLLEKDATSEGLLSRIWRPLFAICYTITFTATGLVLCYLMVRRELSTLVGLDGVTGFLSFYFVAGAAVMGVQVWKRTEERKLESQ